jgi:hypothetical protein
MTMQVDSFRADDFDKLRDVLMDESNPTLWVDCFHHDGLRSVALSYGLPSRCLMSRRLEVLLRVHKFCLNRE